MTLVRWRPMRDVMNMQDEMNRVFDQFFSRDIMADKEFTSTSKWHPLVDISEDQNEFVVTSELPGMKRNDIQITFTNGALKIEGERKKEKEDKGIDYHRVERMFGKFCRTFELPTQIKHDKISADFKDGVLTIHLPKADEVKPKSIAVNIS